MRRPVAGEPIKLSEILNSQLWRYLQNFARHEFQTTMFQPVGGMDMIGKAFAREVGDLISYNAKVTRIAQNDRGVTVTYIDTAAPATPQQAQANWCVCTIPLSVLSQLQLDVGERMKAAIDAVPYVSSVKIGLQFKRRFWEEDEAIYGGISYTDLPIRQIAYPNTGFNGSGRSVLLGAYLYESANAFEFTSMTPASGSRARWNSAPAFIRNTRPNSRMALRSHGIGYRLRWVAPAAGPRRRGRSTMTTFAGSTAASCLRASMPPTFRPGRKAPSCRRSMRSPGCMSGSSGRDAEKLTARGLSRWRCSP